MTVLGVEVAGDHDRSVFGIMVRVREHLLELLILDVSGTAALQVEVVNYQDTAAVLEFGNQRQTSSQPALKQAPFGQVGVRFPKSRLAFEAYRSRGPDRQRCENRLAVISRLAGTALSQLLKLGSEDIIQVQPFGEFLSDILRAAAARVQ